MEAGLYFDRQPQQPAVRRPLSRRPCMLCALGLRNPAFSIMENDVATTSSDIRHHVDLSHMELDSNSLRANLSYILRPSADHQNAEDDDSQSETVTPPLESLRIDFNNVVHLPLEVYLFANIKTLDISSCQLHEIDSGISNLRSLRVLNAKNNHFTNDSLPKNFGLLQNLEELNLSGNQFTTIVRQVTELTSLKLLHVGGNQLRQIPKEIGNLTQLQVLYLGGNRLIDLPDEMGRLVHLYALVLCENDLVSLPASISSLQNLRSLALHRNRLTTLPPEIVLLKGLTELSLRDNPLVVRFVRDMIYNPPSLLELSARCLKIKNIPVTCEDVPLTLLEYLNSAHQCVNPKCKGVYFDTRIEHIKFVDFCGKYRLPLLEYLCSPICTTQAAVTCSSSSDSEVSEGDDDCPAPHQSRLKKVLLG